MMKAVVFLMASLLLLVAGCNKVRDAAATGSQNGTLTRFVTVGNYLYTVDNNHLNTYSIANPAQPVLKGTQPVGFSIQTIFPYQDKLFIGSANAMFIYSIANPEKPTLLSETEYFVRGRDPIVAFDSVAYSTVQNNRLGVGSSGVLNVFNIKNPSLPRRVFMIALQQPFGLGAKDSALYVCDGTAGLKLFNISKPYEPVSRGSFWQQEVFYDLIVEGNTLIAYIKGGVCLIDITNVLDPSLIAKLKN